MRPWRTARGATAVGSKVGQTEWSEARASSRERLTVSDTTCATLATGTLVALAVASGSLYFSLGLGLVPCNLCWYQRTLMYPPVVVLGIATVEDRPDVWKTMFPLSLSGLALLAYYSYLQVAPEATYTIGGPYTSIQHSMLGGLLTIPRLTFIGFALVMVLAAAMVHVGGETDDAWDI